MVYIRTRTARKKYVFMNHANKILGKKKIIFFLLSTEKKKSSFYFFGLICAT